MQLSVVWTENNIHVQLMILGATQQLMILVMDFDDTQNMLSMKVRRSHSALCSIIIGYRTITLTAITNRRKN